MHEKPCPECGKMLHDHGGVILWCGHCGHQEKVPRYIDPRNAELSTLRSRLAAAEAALVSESEARERAERERDGWKETATRCYEDNIGGAPQTDDEIAIFAASKYGPIGFANRILSAAREKGKEGRSDE